MLIHLYHHPLKSRPVLIILSVKSLFLGSVDHLTARAGEELGLGVESDLAPSRSIPRGYQLLCFAMSGTLSEFFPFPTSPS